MKPYFGRFPLVSYNGYTVRNITARPVITDMVSKNLQVFYPYDIRDGHRPEAVAFDYYDDPGYVWLLALSNGYTDLYYDWPLTDDQLNDFIVKKYGSLEKAMKQVVFYRNAWSSDESNISVSEYDALPALLRKYWNPEIGYAGSVVGYVRRQEDWTVTTNKILLLTLSAAAGFTVGERLLQSSTPVAVVNTYETGATTMNAWHVSGAVTTGLITGEDSGATATVSEVDTLTQTIADAEAVYWAPIYAYDYESELNQQKRAIRLLDNRFSDEADSQLKKVLST